MTTLEVGALAPAFNLPNADGELVSLSQLLDKAPKGLWSISTPRQPLLAALKRPAIFAIPQLPGLRQATA